MTSFFCIFQNKIEKTEKDGVKWLQNQFGHHTKNEIIALKFVSSSHKVSQERFPGMAVVVVVGTVSIVYNFVKVT